MGVVDTSEELEGLHELGKYCDEHAFFVRKKGIGPLLRAPHKPYYAESRFVPELQQAIDRVVAERHFDVIQIDQANMAQYLPDTPFSTVTCLSCFNLDHKLFMSNAKRLPVSPMKFAFYFEAAKIWRFERRIFTENRFDGYIFLSSDETKWTHARYPELNLLHLPLGAKVEPIPEPDQSAFHQELGSRPTILFCGKMSFEPNIDAVCWFATSIWPSIKTAVPNVQFLIVGADPHPRVQKLAEDHSITVTGTVKDVYPYFAGADVVVIPMRAGAGIKVKLLESLGRAKLVISTQTGAAGMELEGGKHLLLAESVQDFSSYCIRALGGDPAFLEIASNGHQFVKDHYSWATICDRQLEFYDQLLTSKVSDHKVEVHR